MDGGGGCDWMEEEEEDEREEELRVFHGVFEGFGNTTVQFFSVLVLLVHLHWGLNRVIYSPYIPSF